MMYPQDGDIYAKVDWAIQDGNMGPKSHSVMREVRAELNRLNADIAALTERAEVRGKLAETFGEVLCQIAGTSDRVRACAIASDQFAAMKERAERAEKLYEAAKPLADMMSLAAFRSNPRMSDGYCPPMGGVKEYELRHQAAAIRDAVEKYDTARREAGRGGNRASDS